MLVQAHFRNSTHAFQGTPVYIGLAALAANLAVVLLGTALARPTRRLAPGTVT
jgi:hypothetical protein